VLHGFVHDPGSLLTGKGPSVRIGFETWVGCSDRIATFFDTLMQAARWLLSYWLGDVIRAQTNNRFCLNISAAICEILDFQLRCSEATKMKVLLRTLSCLLPPVLKSRQYDTHNQ